MRTVLDYCSGGVQRSLSAGTVIIHEGGTTGHLFVLIEGRLEVIKGDTVVASIAEPGAVVGEMSVLLDQAAYRDGARGGGFDDLRVRRCRIIPARPAGGGAADRPAAGAAAQCRHHLSRRHHASICRPRRSPRDGRRDPAEHDQPAADKGLARFGSAIRPKDVSHAGGSTTGAAGRRSGALRSMHCAVAGRTARTPCPHRYRARYGPAGGRAAGRH